MPNNILGPSKAISKEVPQLQRKTAFSVTGIGIQNVPSNTAPFVVWDTIVYDAGSNFDTAGNRYIAPLNGLYQLNCLMNCSFTAAPQAGAFVTSVFNVNSGATLYVGTRFHPRGAQSGDNFTLVLTASVLLVKGDSVRVAVSANGSPSGFDIFATQSFRYFSGFRLESESRTIL